MMGQHTCSSSASNADEATFCSGTAPHITGGAIQDRDRAPQNPGLHNSMAQLCLHIPCTGSLLSSLP